MKNELKDMINLFLYPSRYYMRITVFIVVLLIILSVKLENELLKLKSDLRDKDLKISKLLIKEQNDKDLISSAKISNQNLLKLIKQKDSLLITQSFSVKRDVSTYTMISTIKYLINCGEWGKAKTEYENLEKAMDTFHDDKELWDEAKSLSLKIEKGYMDWDYRMHKKKMHSISAIKETPNITFSGFKLIYSGYERNAYDRRSIKFSYKEGTFGYKKARPVMLAYRPVGENLIKVTELSVNSYEREMVGYFDIDKELRKYPILILVSKEFSYREEYSGFGMGFKSKKIYSPDIEIACPDTIHVSNIEQDFFVVKILNRQAI